MMREAVQSLVTAIENGRTDIVRSLIVACEKCKWTFFLKLRVYLLESHIITQEHVAAIEPLPLTDLVLLSLSRCLTLDWHTWLGT